MNKIKSVRVYLYIFFLIFKFIKNIIKKDGPLFRECKHSKDKRWIIHR
jgi:hypothetical protein